MRHPVRPSARDVSAYLGEEAKFRGRQTADRKNARGLPRERDAQAPIVFHVID
jgi:hypothetical protein